ncbi:hypothetical protein J4412_02000 [Candidatus Pacearchaeota archaeon]|nr:MAG: hypothetical protein QJ16_C0005G0129 [archaeon GW2011_AR1]MBS3078255.1 hypothetical protein [Candidatus Pacearchaeota archaeon]HIH52610.1 hypothetical protein [Nanoarchaeota archaeon]
MGEKKPSLDEEKEREINKILRKISTKKQKKLIFEKTKKLTEKEKEDLEETFDDFNETETSLFILGVILIISGIYLGNGVFYFLVIIAIVVFPIIVSSKKKKLIEKIKKLIK